MTCRNKGRCAGVCSGSQEFMASCSSLSCLVAHWRQTLVQSCFFPHSREESLHEQKTVPCVLLDIAVEITAAPFLGIHN